jgi:hypothetical protein
MTSCSIRNYSSATGTWKYSNSDPQFTQWFDLAIRDPWPRGVSDSYKVTSYDIGDIQQDLLCSQAASVSLVEPSWCRTPPHVSGG